MPKIYTIVFFLFVSFSSFAQSNITLKGKIHDKNTQVPIEAATVYLTAVKDSSVIDYTISDKNGIFKIDTRKITKPFFLKISFQGYATFRQEITTLTENKDFGILHLEEIVNTLNEVVIKSEAPPIRIKKDTLEFNASSFKVRPDSNVETLLKQLPGVEVGTDGKITVNGKEVNQILVNGKPFFDKDGKIALQSLPSDIINKVQISDTKTKKEELAGQVSSSNNASINLTIDEDKNKGFFGKFMGGYGTDERYESSALINYFKNKRKISVLASSNNINSTGFSMDEVFDNMGGGRNVSYSSYSDGTYGIGNMRFGGGKGITQSDMVGLNYGDEWGKKVETNGSYFFTNSNSENLNRTKQVAFVGSGDLTTESNAKTYEERLGHNFSFELEYKIDSTTTFVVAPKFAKSINSYDSNSFESQKDENNQLLYESLSESFDTSENNVFSNSINFNKSFKRKGRFLSLSFENENGKEEVNTLNKSNTIDYTDIDPDEIRDQIKRNRNVKDSYFTEIEYAEPLKDSLKVNLAVEYKWKKVSEDRIAYDFDEVAQSYSVENDKLTSYYTSTSRTITPKSGFSINKKKFNFNLEAGTSITKFDNHSLYRNDVADVNKTYMLPYANAYINLKFGKSKSVWANYYYLADFPTASQILEVPNESNPLNTSIGNSNLNPNKYHTAYLSLRDFNTATKSGYSIYMGGNFYENQVVSSTIYHTNGKRTTSYVNASGTYTSWFGGNWNKTIKREAHTFKFGLGGSANFGMAKGVIGREMTGAPLVMEGFEAKSLRLTPRASFTYEYGELLTINPTYNFTYSDTKYTNYSVNSATNMLHRFNIQTTNYWPKNWVFGNDFGYTYNSNIADGFKKDFYLWNTSLSYNFLNKKMTAKVKVYDMLNQNQSATRTITPSAIRDEENIVLKRYAMFSLTYKIEKFAGKEKPARNRMMF
ncbi:outer membrane beta-barrel protein [Flavobacterium sp. GT3R68]|uniref:outer membrane beta-barrel protein n=1 Tax=Flavobacterium sp. GT3R68 TaxID=2594437 RepID=UPI000F887556|nr:outer membrane beta-barrel protein [Flavobacterium sp. GT3R68]RTY90221.1 TonB-dependent receptor [Flavobacterium sp. GSN2]TRW90522.1 outer membrane beta-barrel protein [Flavobacterium sp. GT3R68]